MYQIQKPQVYSSDTNIPYNRVLLHLNQFSGLKNIKVWNHFHMVHSFQRIKICINWDFLLFFLFFSLIQNFCKFWISILNSIFKLKVSKCNITFKWFTASQRNKICKKCEFLLKILRFRVKFCVLADLEFEF